MFGQLQLLANLPSSSSFQFVTVIPKVESPTQLGDFQPIYLVKSLNKLIEKVLPPILSKFMDKLISHNQPA
ncbi:unnamed protein product [Lathyrus oleraceus]